MEILRKVRGLNMCAIVRVRDTVHTRVRYSIGRFRVEQVIGIVKNRFRDRDFHKPYGIFPTGICNR